MNTHLKAKWVSFRLLSTAVAVVGVQAITSSSGWRADCSEWSALSLANLLVGTLDNFRGLAQMCLYIKYKEIINIDKLLIPNFIFQMKNS